MWETLERNNVGFKCEHCTKNVLNIECIRHVIHIFNVLKFWVHMWCSGETKKKCGVPVCW